MTYHFGTKERLRKKALANILEHGILYDKIFAPGDAMKSFNHQELADALGSDARAAGFLVTRWT